MNITRIFQNGVLIKEVVGAPFVIPKLPSIGPGTELKNILAKFGFHQTKGCKCEPHRIAMDQNGPDWCEKNIDTIIGWLKDEAAREGLPFIAPAARILVRRAIAKSRR